MAYIAVKNTEHKGVYKEKDFNKEIYKTKGISHRRFKEEELEEALEWAKVKDIKGMQGNNKSTKKKNIPAANTNKEENKLFNIIMDYKNKGYEGICLTTKNLGEIILKLNDFAVVSSRQFKNFDENKESLFNHFKNAIEEARVEAERRRESIWHYYPLGKKIEAVKLKCLSEVKMIDSKYIRLDNFWSAPRLQNPFESGDIMLSRVFKMDRYKDEYWNSYSDVILNCDEVIAMKPLGFKLKEYGIGDYLKDYSNCKRIKMKISEAREIEEMFKKVYEEIGIESSEYFKVMTQE